MAAHEWGVDLDADIAEIRRMGIHYCIPEDPWKQQTKRAVHPLAAEVEDSQRAGWPSGDTVRMKCPTCGHTWTKELPQ